MKPTAASSPQAGAPWHVVVTRARIVKRNNAISSWRTPFDPASNELCLSKMDNQLSIFKPFAGSLSASVC
jgi:hypothetical protein